MLLKQRESSLVEDDLPLRESHSVKNDEQDSRPICHAPTEERRDLEAGPLPAAAPGTVLPPPSSSPARARSCRIRLLSVTRKRRPVVRVRATAGKRALRGTRIVARPAKRGTVLARARTDATGRARLVLPKLRTGRVRVSAQHRRSCAPVEIRWRRLSVRGPK